ncbi:MAG: xanthine dehydrogenase family protein subunit M [Gemmatimonadota bacterium]|nr:xanthine dehydrogenase family protein subunit M [Gemmatimonadota bacterium]
MKPAPFEYVVARSVEETLAGLAEHADDVKVLAGGQSLIPAMNFRLAQPAVLVDVNGVDELDFVRVEGGELRIGAVTRQRTVERSEEVRRLAPLLHEAIPSIAHPQIRNRGTVGGSLVHADPSAELPSVMVALGARMRIRGPAGERWVAADDFFVGLLETAVGSDELLLEVAVPEAAAGAGHAFLELQRRHGDYAMAGVAAAVALDGSGRCAGARIALLSVGDGPVLAAGAAGVLTGETPSAELFAAAARAAAHDDIDPPGDIQASAPYRRHLVEVLVRRALTLAFQRADASGARA